MGEQSGATTRGYPRLSIPVMLNEVKHLSGQAAGGSFTSFRMTIGREWVDKECGDGQTGPTPIVS